jgi:hypothetical protein
VTNADVVAEFLAKRRIEVGDAFVLPDEEQRHRVMAVRVFPLGSSWKVFIDLRTSCLECGRDVDYTRVLRQWRSRPHVSRCCSLHKGTRRTPRGWWLTSEELAAREQAAKGREALARNTKLKGGRVERAVTLAADGLLAVYGQVNVYDVAEAAIAMLELPAKGKRDTRRQRVHRAIARMRERGRLPAGVVWRGRTGDLQAAVT